MDDFLIIGSGFGGSVSALRLAEKGYSVRILEKRAALRGRRLSEEQLESEALAVAPGGSGFRGTVSR